MKNLSVFLFSAGPLAAILILSMTSAERVERVPENHWQASNVGIHEARAVDGTCTLKYRYATNRFDLLGDTWDEVSLSVGEEINHFQEHVRLLRNEGDRDLKVQIRTVTEQWGDMPVGKEVSMLADLLRVKCLDTINGESPPVAPTAQAPQSTSQDVGPRYDFRLVSIEYERGSYREMAEKRLSSAYLWDWKLSSSARPADGAFFNLTWELKADRQRDSDGDDLMSRVRDQSRTAVQISHPRRLFRGATPAGFQVTKRIPIDFLTEDVAEIIFSVTYQDNPTLNTYHDGTTQLVYFTNDPPPGGERPDDRRGDRRGGRDGE